MAQDTFVHWKKKGEKRPTRAQLQPVLEDYVKGLATEVRWDKDRFFVTLHGTPSWPFARVPGVSENKRQATLEDAVEDDGSPRYRWFEVWLGPKSVDVMTRSMDEVTGNIARGFARLVARFWQGELEDD